MGIAATGIGTNVNLNESSKYHTEVKESTINAAATATLAGEIVFILGVSTLMIVDKRSNRGKSLK